MSYEEEDTGLQFMRTINKQHNTHITHTHISLTLSRARALSLSLSLFVCVYVYR
jgi:hypothetical protein